jgi:beta-xylosidase
MNLPARSRSIPRPPPGCCFYDQALYCGLGFDAKAFVTHQYGMERGRPANPHAALRMRLRNDRHIVSLHTSGDDGQTWQRFDRGMEVSGYHHNVRGGFRCCAPASMPRARGSPLSRFPFSCAGLEFAKDLSAFVTPG